MDPLVVEMQMGVATDKLTVRDEFAIAALNGMLCYDAHGTHKDFARLAYEQADAMMEARKCATSTPAPVTGVGGS